MRKLTRSKGPRSTCLLWVCVQVLPKPKRTANAIGVEGRGVSNLICDTSECGGPKKGQAGTGENTHADSVAAVVEIEGERLVVDKFFVDCRGTTAERDINWVVSLQ